MIWIVGCSAALVVGLIHTRFIRGMRPKREVMMLVSGLTVAAALLGNNGAPIFAGILMVLCQLAIWPSPSQAVVPRRSPATLPPSADDVIESFGKTLATQAPQLGCVADENELPYPKAVVKAAIVSRLRTTSDPKLRKVLKVAYLSLASWQPNIGPRQGRHLFPPSAMADDDQVGYAKWMVEQGDDLTKWPGLISTEVAELRAELVREQLW